MIKDVYKKNKKTIILFYLITIFIVFILCFQHAKPKKEESIFIFMSGQKILAVDVDKQLEEKLLEYGILEVSSFGYDETDSSFSQAFATKGFYSSDLFILSKDVIDKYKETNAFKPLTEEVLCLSDEYIRNSSGEVIAISINEEYYILVGQKRNKQDDVISKAIECIVLNGDDLFE